MEPMLPAPRRAASKALAHPRPANVQVSGLPLRGAVAACIRRSRVAPTRVTGVDRRSRGARSAPRASGDGAALASTRLVMALTPALSATDLASAPTLSSSSTESAPAEGMAPLLARERLWHHGAERVSDEELVAVVLGTGMRGKSVWEVASEVMRNAGGLPALSRASPQELTSISGIGACRALRVVAAFELGRRALAGGEPSPRLLGPEDVARLMSPRLAGLAQECFFVLGINARNQLLAEVPVARGTLLTVEVHPREVFRPLIRMAAAAAILVHNHPSGDPTPSAHDLEVTSRLRAVGELVGIPVIDHLVIAGARYRSITEWVGATL